ncbi:MAG: hypothetical protein KKD05_03000 [Candidatus Omnitrophica bacterium]|nr:hypothetical protein [Candidatus Omnitrophota bacterium]
MNALDKEKKTLKNKGYSETQIQEIQDTLYKLADVLVTAYFKGKGTVNNKG